MEILYRTLNAELQQNDTIITLWTFFARGAVIKPEGIEKYGLWLPDFKKWLGVRTYDHLIIESWLYMHHAELYLNSLGIKNYSYVIEQGYMEQNKPKCVSLQNLRNLQGFYKEMKDLASDNAHPGPITHQGFADLVYQNLLKEQRNG